MIHSQQAYTAHNITYTPNTIKFRSNCLPKWSQKVVLTVVKEASMCPLQVNPILALKNLNLSSEINEIQSDFLLEVMKHNDHAGCVATRMKTKTRGVRVWAGQGDCPIKSRNFGGLPNQRRPVMQSMHAW